MVKRGRKSAASLGVVPLHGDRTPPEPPAELTAEQAAEWKNVVNAMPWDWFRAEVHSLLSAYCRHICRARFLSLELDRFEAEWLADEDGPARYNKLSAAAERETRAALALARSMRLTHQAQYDAQRASRDRLSRGGQRGVVPWGDDVKGIERPW